MQTTKNEVLKRVYMHQRFPCNYHRINSLPGVGCWSYLTAATVLVLEMTVHGILIALPLHLQRHKHPPST